MIPERKQTKILTAFNKSICPKCKSKEIIMNVANINSYTCKKCGKKFEAKYDE